MDTFHPFKTFFQKHSFSSQLALTIKCGNDIAVAFATELKNLQPITTELSSADDNGTSELSSDEESISTKCHVCLGNRSENLHFCTKV